MNIPCKSWKYTFIATYKRNQARSHTHTHAYSHTHAHTFTCTRIRLRFYIAYFCGQSTRHDTTGQDRTRHDSTCFGLAWLGHAASLIYLDMTIKFISSFLFACLVKSFLASVVFICLLLLLSPPFPFPILFYFICCLFYGFCCYCCCVGWHFLLNLQLVLAANSK